MTQAASPSLITDEMRDFVGQESLSWPLELDRTSIRMFARSVGHTDPIYYDVEEARAAGYPDLPAPPGYLGTAIFYPWLSDPTSGSPRSEVPEPQPARELTRELNGGTEIEYFADVHAGELLTITWTVLGYEEKQASIGHMLLTRRRATYRRGDDVVATLTHTHIQY